MLDFLNRHRFLRDFAEGALAAAIAGAAAAVLALNLDGSTASDVARGALFGAIAAVIAYARHRLEDARRPS